MTERLDPPDPRCPSCRRTIPDDVYDDHVEACAAAAEWHDDAKFEERYYGRHE